MNVYADTENRSIICEGKNIGFYDFDKKQDLYIMRHDHPSYSRGYRFIYSSSPSGIAKKIERRIKNYLNI